MTTAVYEVASVLKGLGFTAFDEHPAADADRVADLSSNGSYSVLGAWRNGDVIVHVEQNVAPESFSDENGNVFTAAEFAFPPVLVVEDTRTGGRVSCSFGDIDAFTRVVQGDLDFNENGDSAPAATPSEPPPGE